ncbi:hypothetical protein [Pseudonocardia sp. NPDC049154]|uniref:hypothetical protein n=1 Tax=Pseudonocardia sp. NPDC049154 TaxID=3155501 RepID=UPI0033D196EF
MSIPEAEPHVSAVIAKLKAGVPTTLGVALGVGPAANPPYLAIYPDPGDVEDARLCGDRSKLTIHFMVHAVGAGPEQATWALDKARAVLLGDPPTVSGRRTHRMSQTLGAVPVTRDETTQPPLYIALAEFRLVSQAA